MTLTFQSVGVVPIGDVSYADDVNLAIVFLLEIVDFGGTCGTVAERRLVFILVTSGKGRYSRSDTVASIEGFAHDVRTNKSRRASDLRDQSMSW